MYGRRLLLGLTALCVGVGSLVAHEAAYVLAHGDDAGAVLARTGHGYLGQTPLVVATAIAIALVAAVLGRLDRRRAALPAAWPFALAAPVAFALQEHIERLVATGHVPVAAVLEPTFALGIALQIPFALAAWLVARSAFRACRALVRRARRRRRPTWARRPAPTALRPGLVERPAPAMLAGRAAGRAPPVR